MSIRQDNKLTIKQTKFVKAKVEGKKNAEAYISAGYKASSRGVAEANSSKLLRKDNIQRAIDNALDKVGATPEFAVQVLAEVAEQDKEIGARRLAAKDILELHGWRKDERPQNTLQITNAFFSNIVESNKAKAIDVEQ